MTDLFTGREDDGLQVPIFIILIPITARCGQGHGISQIDLVVIEAVDDVIGIG